MYNVRTNDIVYSGLFPSKLEIQEVKVLAPISRVEGFRHLKRSAGCISQVQKLELDSRKKLVEPKKLKTNLY